MTEFAYVDVFASAPLTGAPLTLVPDADALTDAQMRGIAREFNQSETTFVLTPTAPGATRRLRSFTPTGEEVFGAGHNALGAWLWLAGSLLDGAGAASHQGTGSLPDGAGATSHQEPASLPDGAGAASHQEPASLPDGAGATFQQEIGEAVLPVHVSRGEDGRFVVAMEQSPPVFGAVAADRAGLAAALGLSEDDLVPDRPARVVSTGAGHLLVPVRSRAAVDRAVVDADRLVAALRAVGGEGCYVYTFETTAYARFFNPAMGIPEDPATGTAAGPLAALLVHDGVVPSGAVTIEQGHAMGRPSVITVTVTGSRVVVSGSGVIAATGSLRLTAPDDEQLAHRATDDERSAQRPTNDEQSAHRATDDERFLRRAIEIATSARADGEAPFGSLLVDAAGQVIAEEHNTVRSDGDITAHPELKLARWAAQHLSAGDAAAVTMYTSCQPCGMCSGAIDRSGLGRVVFALSTAQLDALKPGGGIPAVVQHGPALLDAARAALHGYYA